LIADLGLLAVCVFLRRRPPWWAWLIAAPIAVTSEWGATWWAPLWTAARIVALATALGAFRPRMGMVTLGLCMALWQQTAGLAIVIGHPRPSGYTENASVLGQVGLAVLLVTPVAGIGAIPVSTELRLAYRTALQKSLTDNPDELSPYKYLAPTIDAVKQVITARLKLFNGL